MKKPAKNILYLFLGDISTRLVGFFVVTYLANTLGSSGFGKINISLAILSYAILFGGSGLPILGTREISLNEKNKEIFIGNLISARFISSIVIFIIFFLLSETLYNDDISTLNFIYLFFLFPYSLILDWFFQAKKRMDIIAFSRFTGMMVYLILIFSFVKKSNDYNTVAIAWVGNGIVISVIMAVFFYFNYNIKFKLTKDSFKLILKSFPLAGTGILSQVVLQSPALILSWVTTTDDIGIFNIAFRIITLSLIFDRIFYMMYLPLVSKEYAERPEQITLFFTRFLKMITFCALGMGVLIFVFSEQIILILFSSVYIRSISVLKILTIYFMLTLIISVFTYTLIAMGREKEFLKALFISSILYFILVYPLVLISNITGMALCIIVYEVSVLCYLIFKIKYPVRIPFLRILLLPVLLVLLYMFLNNFYFINDIFIDIFLFIVLVSILFLLIGISRDDVIYFKRVLL